MAQWHSLNDDREVSDSYARRYPDAVYDADDPEWRQILEGEEDADEEEETDGDGDESDGDFSDRTVTDEWDEYIEGDESGTDDDDWYEIEIGLDYAPE